jgi:Uma2 family endonuclease
LPQLPSAEHTIGMPAVETYWTAEMVRALPDDGNRYECIDGELLVSPSPRTPHQRAVGELYYGLRQHCDPLRVVEVLTSPADVELEPTTLVQPDVFIYPLIEGRGAAVWSELTSLRVAIEVLSPSTARHDRVTKRRFFRRVGVPEFWVVDIASEVIEISTPTNPDVRVESETLLWTPPGQGTPFELPLAPFFRYVRTGLLDS